MTRQSRRYYNREIRKCLIGMAIITEDKNVDIVGHNQYEFLKYKAERLRRRYNADDVKTSQE